MALHLSPNALSVGELAKLIGVHPSTIRRWCREGRIKETFRTFGNHRRFDESAFKHLYGKEDTKKSKVVGYARVSSHDQKGDLETQKQRLEQTGCDEVICDLGSGLNCRKPGLKKILRMIWQGEIKVLRIIHGDRLLRFGKELIFYWCFLCGVKVEILDEAKKEAFESELVKDVLTLMTVFSACLYGKRSRKNKKAVSAAPQRQSPTDFP